MNKKGAVIGWASSIGLVLAILIFFFIIRQQGVNAANVYIGQGQLNLLKQYESGEKALLFVDQSAKRAAGIAAVNLAEKGGLLFEKCGTYAGYNIWATPDSACYPEFDILSGDYLQLFDERLDSLFSLYKDAQIPKSNYELFLKQDDTLLISGSAAQPLIIGTEIPEEPVPQPKPVVPSNIPSLIWPTQGRIASCYGWRNLQGQQDWHDGADIGVVPGTPVKSAADGQVYRTCGEWTGPCACSAFDSSCPKTCLGKCGNYGNFVIVKSSDNFYTLYAHLSEVIVKDGQAVKQGDVIARSGNTGLSEAPHLHFAVFFSSASFKTSTGQGSYERNPFCYLPKLPPEQFKPGDCTDSDGYGLCPASASPVEQTPRTAGTIYSVLPSFSTEVNYSLDDYEKISADAKRFVGDLNSALGKSNSKALIKGLLDAKNKNNKEFEYSLECDDGPDKPLNDLTELYQDCLNANDSNCLCSSPVSVIGKYTFQTKDNAQDKTFDMSLVDPKWDLKHTFDSSLSWLPDKFAFENNKVTLTGKTYGFNSIDTINLYKSANDKMDFVTVKNNKITYPDGREVVPDNLHNCNVNKKIFRFCVKKNDQQFITYNKYTNKPELKNPVYKFAMYLEDKVSPPPVENVAITDTAKAEKNVTISWKKDLADDVVKYRVYFSESQFTDVSQAALVQEVTQNSDSDANGYSITYKVAEDGKAYWFAVTAVDGAGNVNNAVSSVSGTSADDLSPGRPAGLSFSTSDDMLSATMPAANEDGSDIQESSLSAEAYAYQTDSSCSKDLSQYSRVVTQASAKGAQVMIKISLDKTKQYCLALLARDGSGNPKPDYAGINALATYTDSPQTLS